MFRVSPVDRSTRVRARGRGARGISVVAYRLCIRHLSPTGTPAQHEAVSSTLRESYEQWCEQVGERPVSAKRLTQELRDRFSVVDARGSKGRRFYAGVVLVDFGEDQDASAVES